MKIWLPINTQRTGGSSSFATKFKIGMEQRGHEVFLGLSSPLSYNVLLVSPRAPLSRILTARRHGKKIIHRLDGAYYPATPAGWLFPAYNAPLTAIQYLSHYTVYQSQYARRICQRLVGPRPQNKSTIIYNGINTNHFTPEGLREDRPTSLDQHTFITAQQFRRRDQIEPLVLALDTYRKRYQKNATLIIAGDFISDAASLFSTLQKNPALQLLGPLENDKLPPYLRTADAFLYCHPNPACPNNVLEAMACGLPIIGINDGAMPELVRHKQDGFLVRLPGNGHIIPRRFNPAAFANAMHDAISHKKTYGPAARVRILETFTVEHMLDQYQSVLSAL